MDPKPTYFDSDTTFSNCEVPGLAKYQHTLRRMKVQAGSVVETLELAGFAGMVLDEYKKLIEVIKKAELVLTVEAEYERITRSNEYDGRLDQAFDGEIRRQCEIFVKSLWQSLLRQQTRQLLPP